MSEMPIPDSGSSDAQIDDESIQRGWDRFAMFDLAVERKSRGSRRVFTKRSSTDAISAVAYDSTTALGDAFARTESTGLAHENTDAADDRVE